MIIGVVVALHWEAKCLQHLTIDAAPQIRWTLTGMGPVAAATGAQALIDQGARLLISFGCAAGLQPDIQPGALLLPQQVLQADGTPLDCDRHWWQRFSDQLAGACHAPLVETAAVLSTGAAKTALAVATQAAAADMESAAVLRTAERHGIPALVTRTVLDNAGQTLPAGLVECCDAYAQPKTWRLAGWLARKPARLKALVALAGAQRQARHSLAAIARILERME